MANNKQYFDEHLDFLREQYKKMKIEDLTEAFNSKFGMNKSEQAIKTVLYKNKIKCGRDYKNRFLKRKNILTVEQDDYLRVLYQKMTAVESTKKLNAEFGTNFSESQIIGYIGNNKIKSGRAGCFQKGSAPWNKGSKGLIPPGPSSFKKGHIGPTIKQLYSERMNKDGIIEIKVPVPRKGFKTSYMPKQRWVYEQHNGTIPAGHVVSFLDGDILNFDPDNLIALSRAELLRLNKNEYRQQPDELKPTVLALSKLQVGICAKKREFENEL